MQLPRDRVYYKFNKCWGKEIFPINTHKLSLFFQQVSIHLAILWPKKDLVQEPTKTRRLSQRLGEILQNMRQLKGADLPWGGLNRLKQVNLSRTMWCCQKIEERPRTEDEASGTNNRHEHLHALTQLMISLGGATNVLKLLQTGNNLRYIIVMGWPAERTWLALTVANHSHIQWSTALTWKHTLMKDLLDVATAQAPSRAPLCSTNTCECIWLKGVWARSSRRPDTKERVKSFIFEKLVNSWSKWTFVHLHTGASGLELLNLFFNFLNSQRSFRSVTEIYYSYRKRLI